MSSSRFSSAPATTSAAFSGCSCASTGHAVDRLAAKRDPDGGAAARAAAALVARASAGSAGPCGRRAPDRLADFARAHAVPQQLHRGRHHGWCALDVEDDAPPRFDTPRRLLVFFIAVLAGTVISGWFDAAAVTLSIGDPFWTVWRHRLFSNILAQLTIVTAIVGVATSLPRWRSASWSRIVEAAFVWTGLIAIGMTDIGGLALELQPLRAVSSQAPLALQLPFLLWAAVRFGVAGAGITLFTATILSVWSVVHGQGPFAEMSPTTTVAALTLSLIVVASTVLALAALVEERRHTQSALAERLNFEELLARLSGAFVEVSSDRMDAGFDEWLGKIGRFLSVKCVRVYVLTERNDLVARYEWLHPHFVSAAAAECGEGFSVGAQPSAAIAAAGHLVVDRAAAGGGAGPPIDGALWLQGHARPAARRR